MQARVITVQAQPGKKDEVIRIYQAVTPAVKQQKGFKSGLLLSDSDTGKCMSISMWETENDMTASEKATSGYLKEQILKLATLALGPPIREHYEIVFQI